jgi:hypothetical protein
MFVLALFWEHFSGPALKNGHVNFLLLFVPLLYSLRHHPAVATAHEHPLLVASYISPERAQAYVAERRDFKKEGYMRIKPCALQENATLCRVYGRLLCVFFPETWHTRHLLSSEQNTLGEQSILGKKDRMPSIY